MLDIWTKFNFTFNKSGVSKIFMAENALFISKRVGNSLRKVSFCYDLKHMKVKSLELKINL